MKARERLLQNANDDGAQVHAAIEACLKGRGRARADRRTTAALAPLSVEGMVTCFAGEVPVFAGTYDLLAERPDGSLVLIDWKTSASVGHVEQRLQNVAYRTALRQMGIEAPIAGLLARGVLRVMAEGLDFVGDESPRSSEDALLLSGTRAVMSEAGMGPSHERSRHDGKRKRTQGRGRG